MPLDVMSSGTTPQEARQALDEAVRVFLLTAADLGTLDQVLEESGYERRGTDGCAPLRRRRTTRARPGGVSGCLGSHPCTGDLKRSSSPWVSCLRARKAPIDLTSSQEYRPVVIPTYSEVPVLDHRNNLKTASLSREEFLALLKRLSKVFDEGLPGSSSCGYAATRRWMNG